MSKNDSLISERTALSYLMRNGDFTEAQARIVLGHSKRSLYNGAPYYPLSYIAKRARDHKMKKNPKRGKRLIPSAKSRKRAKAKRVFRPVRRVLKGAKLKPRRRHTAAKRKRESFIICAPHENRRTVYYWTGQRFDTDKSKAQKFPSLVAARTFAHGILKRLPSVLTELEIKRG